jgi:hypothetical protein
MDGRDSIQSLLALRKLTRAITDAVRVQMTDAEDADPLLRPKAVLGEFVRAAQSPAARPTRRSRICRRSATRSRSRSRTLPRELSVP